MINGYFQISLFTFRIKWIINDRIVTSSQKNSNQNKQTNKQTKKTEKNSMELSLKLIEYNVYNIYVSHPRFKVVCGI